ncbi:hypothetical protein [Brevibacterium aurantiacum]|uniref:hypothetical protein n=1 Tax=Brevibacterium aurantiacum TaxID=273384 RepID=UPI0018673B21|nr:hypothetical protein [Brevibacterium aurantiacum]
MSTATKLPKTMAIAAALHRASETEEKVCLTVFRHGNRRGLGNLLIELAGYPDGLTVES